MYFTRIIEMTINFAKGAHLISTSGRHRNTGTFTLPKKRLGEIKSESKLMAPADAINSLLKRNCLLGLFKVVQGHVSRQQMSRGL